MFITDNDYSYSKTTAFHLENKLMKDSFTENINNNLFLIKRLAKFHNLST